MLGMLRLVNPPGTPRKRPFPSYATVTSNPSKKRLSKRAKQMREVAFIAVEDLVGGKPLTKSKARRRRMKLYGAAAAAVAKKKKAKKATKKVAKNPSASTAAKRGGRNMAKLKGAAKAAFLRRMAAGRRKAGLKVNPPKAAKKASKKAAKKAKRTPAQKAATKKMQAARRRATRTIAKHARGYHVNVVSGGLKGKKRKVVRRTPSAVVYVRTSTSKKGKKRPYGLMLTKVNRKTKKGVKRVVRPRLLRAYRNPDFKAMLIQGGMLWAGVVGMKAINSLIGKYVVDKLELTKPNKDGTPKSQTTINLVGMLPAVAGFVAAAFAGKVIKGQPKLVEGLQVGATIQLLNQAFSAFVVPALITKDTPADSILRTMFAPSGVGEYLPLSGGYGEYLQPRRQLLGAPVQEALALDEYVSGFGGAGFDVEEALADSEASGLQTGYAGGSLARTAFSS